MTRILSLILAAGFSLAALGASAQNWTGGYVGGQIGSLNADTTATPSGRELSYGLHAGYTSEVGPTLVLGGELEYDWTDINLGAATVNAVGRAKVIAGINSGLVMPYLTIGGARLDTSIGNANGWLAGLGVAYQVTPNVSLSGEILYHEFTDIGATTIDADATAINVRASYRF